MSEDEFYQKLAAEQVSIEECGGFDAFTESTDRYLIVSRVKQRAFARFLDSLGEEGKFRVNPFEGELELRGHTFKAQCLGSFGGSDWLWAHRNELLGLAATSTTIGRALCEQWTSIFAQQLCIDFPNADRWDVMHRFAAVPTALGLSEAYYIANDSLVYVVLPGEVPENHTVTDLVFTVNEYLVEGSATWSLLEYATRQLGIQWTPEGNNRARVVKGLQEATFVLDGEAILSSESQLT